MHFLIYGADTYSSFHKLLELKKAFLKKNPSGEVSTFENDWKLTDLITLTNQQGLFTNPKLIIVKNSLLKPFTVPLRRSASAASKPKSRKKITPEEDPTQQIINLLDSDSATTHFVFYEDSEPDKKFKPTALWQKLSLDKKNVFYFPAPASGLALETLVKNYLTKNNHSIEPAALKKLLAFCPDDLWLITSELDKLMSFAAGRAITPTDVEALVMPAIPDDIFALVSAIADKQEKTAAKLLEQQLANGLNELALLKLLQREFRFLWHIKAGLDSNRSVADLALALHSYDFVIRKKLALAKKVSNEQLRGAYFLLLKAESNIKTSSLPPASLLTLLINTLHKQL